MPDHPLIRHKDILFEVLTLFAPVENDWDSSSPSEQTIECRDILARCSLVCKTFSESALDILWKDLPHWTALLRLLPFVRKVPVDANKHSPFVYVCCGSFMSLLCNTLTFDFIRF